MSDYAFKTYPNHCAHASGFVVFLWLGHCRCYSSHSGFTFTARTMLGPMNELINESINQCTSEWMNDWLTPSINKKQNQLVNQPFEFSVIARKKNNTTEYTGNVKLSPNACCRDYRKCQVDASLFLNKPTDSRALKMVSILTTVWANLYSHIAALLMHNALINVFSIHKVLPIKRS